MYYTRVFTIHLQLTNFFGIDFVIKANDKKSRFDLSEVIFKCVKK